jgi:hypothetical protein
MWLARPGEVPNTDFTQYSYFEPKGGAQLHNGSSGIACVQRINVRFYVALQLKCSRKVLFSASPTRASGDLTVRVLRSI